MRRRLPLRLAATTVGALALTGCGLPFLPHPAPASRPVTAAPSPSAAGSPSAPPSSALTTATATGSPSAGPSGGATGGPTPAPTGATPSAGGTATPPAGYARYSVPKFGCHVDYPTWMTVSPAPSGDGATISGRGVTMRVWGFYLNVQPATRDSTRADLVANGVAITYAGADDDRHWVLSGTLGDYVVYQRWVIAEPQGCAADLRYAVSQKALVDPVAQQVYNSLDG